MAAPIVHDERKTNERPGVRAVHRYARFSAYKARQVLDLIRGKSVAEARSILQFCERDAAEAIAKVLDSAVANAANNNDIPPDELFVAACFADEGPTLKRWRPRARGRATRIRKRTCHITVIVGRYSSDELDRIRERMASRGTGTADARAARARRVARSRAAEGGTDESAEPTVDEAASEAEAAEAEADRAATEATVEDEFAETAGAADEPEAADATDADADDADATDADGAAEGGEPTGDATATDEKDD